MKTILAVILTLAASAAHASDWTWIRIEPENQKGWTVAKGPAEVTIIDGHVNAVLRTDDDPKFDAFSVKGEIHGKSIDATVIELGTDADPMHMSGTMKSIRTPSSSPAHGWGSDRITLSNSDWYLGLFRTTAPQ